MADKSFISRAKSDTYINIINLFNKQIIAVPRTKPSRNDTIATLPVTLFLLMDVRHFDAPLFVLGTAWVVIAAMLLLFVAFSTPRDGPG
jgi:hypothetical protein